MNIIRDEIKSRIKMPELLRHYGIDIVRGRIKCPLHNGTDRNCGVMPDYIHCFVCGESADQISFVMKHFNITYNEAISKINDDFCLGLSTDKVDRRQLIEYSRRQFEREKERKAEERKRQRVFEKYLDAVSLYLFCDRIIKCSKPKNESEELNNVFVYALHNYERAKYELEIAESEVIKINGKSKCFINEC
ncbi:MAG: hypothetical protein KBS62_00290 [Oscillospiraceae bacterium]|nr:hypothetical protein [Candidatus Ruminococcus equi]